MIRPISQAFYAKEVTSQFIKQIRQMQYACDCAPYRLYRQTHNNLVHFLIGRIGKKHCVGNYCSLGRYIVCAERDISLMGTTTIFCIHWLLFMTQPAKISN